MRNKLKFIVLAAVVFLSTASLSQVVSGTAGKLTWSLNPNDSTLTITGKGAMSNYNYSDCLSPWYEHRNAIAAVIIGNKIANIGDYAFLDCSNLTSITIPNSVVKIGMAAFRTCNSLKYVNIPNSVKNIGKEAFFDCSGLTSVIISSSITSINEYLFYRCSNLISVHIPNKVTTIEDYAFYQCGELSSINIPGGVINIGSRVFSQCKKLTSITIPNKLASIGDFAFQDCVALTSVAIPPNVISIGIYAFGFCTNLTAIDVDSNNTVFSSEDGILFNKNKTTIIQYPSGKANRSYVIPNSVTIIGTSAFRVSRLFSITVPNSVSIINDFAFSASRNLTSVTIGSGVAKVEHGVFVDCTALGRIYLLGENPPMVNDEHTFFGVNKNTCVLFVPVDFKEKYASAVGWKEFVNIKEIAFPK